MPASLRELRQRKSSVATTQKITKAMELIAASRIVKADRAARAALPYTSVLNRAVGTVANHTDIDHPLTKEPEQRRRAAVVLFTSDRGLAGGYSTNAIKASLRLKEKLESEGLEVEMYVSGRKGNDFLGFRQIPVKENWQGYTDAPTYEDAAVISDAVLESFLKPYEEGGADEIYAVYTRMVSMLVQEPRVRRVLPIEVVEEGPDTEKADLGDAQLEYSFEPDPEAVLDQLLGLYVRNRIWFYLLESAASELASRQKAMKSATDNAQQLINSLTTEINQARQAQITQEITEIVGGASALTEASAAE
ncbi:MULTISPECIES: F0F1 ATP synthase subunit gamma [unclassified Luteococcus]|uniref:F0F1 ATP synthase subunit gamma n=1 Tax=unclassified Luteococcus TaxID=2639923 RepID=UPI00313B29C0